MTDDGVAVHPDGAESVLNILFVSLADMLLFNIINVLLFRYSDLFF